MLNKQEAKVFTFNENNKPIRVELVDGEPWFVAKDVCDALTIGNSRDAISRLDDDEKGVSVVATPSGEQQMNIVNESGLYNLIFQSRKPEAKKFRKWLIGESLQQGELTQVALELGVSRQTVYMVLNGYSRNAKVLMALYQRAKANRACGMLYFEPKVMAEKLVSGDGDVVVTLPSVQIAGKRGGKLGNQNARKHWRKEGK